MNKIEKPKIEIKPTKRMFQHMKIVLMLLSALESLAKAITFSKFLKNWKDLSI